MDKLRDPALLPEVLQPTDKVSFFLYFSIFKFSLINRRDLIITVSLYFAGVEMAQNSKRLLPEEDTDENDSVQKQICIIHFEDCKHEEKFNYLHDCQNAEERFSKIHDIRRRRSEEPASFAQRMDSVCQLIPNEMQPEHGYYRECYQRFIMNLGRLKQGEYVNEKSATGRRSSTTNSDRILFKTERKKQNWGKEN